MSKTFSPCFYRVLNDFICTHEENNTLTNTYVQLAAISLPLAPLDNLEKAFHLATSGFILGIAFRTPDSHWQIPQDKADQHVAFLWSLLCKPSLCMAAKVAKDATVPNSYNI